MGNNYKKYLEELSDLEYLGFILRNLRGFHPNITYTREVNRGFWMILKELCIKKYIETYCMILGANKERKLYFIDLLASNGLVELAEEKIPQKLYLPGSSLLAAVQNSQERTNIFTRIYSNDYKLQNRICLKDRFDAMNTRIADKSRKIQFSIDTTRENLDSNIWVQEILRTELNDPFCHSLVLIDNEGLNIPMATLKALKRSDKGKYMDFIIHYPWTSINRRSGNSDELERFFGINVDQYVENKDGLYAIYRTQLKKIGFKYIEDYRVQAGDCAYNYILIFAVSKKESEASWLKEFKQTLLTDIQDCTGKDMLNWWNQLYGSNEGTLYKFTQSVNNQIKRRFRDSFLDEYLQLADNEELQDEFDEEDGINS